MQTRSLGTVALVLYGAYTLVAGIGYIRNTMEITGFSEFGPSIIALGTEPVLGVLIIGLRHKIATFLFPEDKALSSSVKPEDMLAVGLAILGIWWFCTVPRELIVGFFSRAGESTWSVSAKGPLVADGLLLVLAGYLVLRSRRIACWMWSKGEKA